MKLRTLPLIAGFAALASPALAYDVCGTPGDYAVLDAPDGLSHAVFFNNFYITAPGGTTEQATCTAEVAAGDPTGYSIFTSDYRGYAFIEATQSATFTAVGPNGETVVVTKDGPYGDNFDATDLIGTRPGQALVVDLTLDLDGGDASAPDANAGLDTADFARIGFTTWDSVKSSIDQLAAERAAVITHVGGTAGLLVGVLRPLEGPNEAGPIAAVGSGLVGVTGRYNFNSGFSFLGGVAYFGQTAPGVAVGPSLLLAGAIRYVEPSQDRFRLFGEAGLWGSPRLDLAFTRQYMNGDDVVAIESETQGFLAGAYVRFGGLYAINAGNELAVSATLSHSSLHVAGYAEPFGMDNLFAATVEDGTTRQNAIRADVAWTTELSPALDLTIIGAIGHGFGGTSGVRADVAFVDTVEGDAVRGTFVEYGARLAWHASPTTTIEAFALATSGREIGTHAQFGGALRFAF